MSFERRQNRLSARHTGLPSIPRWAAPVGIAAVGLLAWVVIADMHVPTTLDDTNSEVLGDDWFFVSVRAPRGWESEKKADPDSLARLKLISPDRSIAVNVYALHSKGTIDREKFLAADRQIFPKLGRLEKERFVRNYLLVYATERVYGKGENGLYSTARFKVSGSYAYVAMATSRSADMSVAIPVLDSLNPEIPLGARARDKMAAIFSFDNLLGSIGGFLLSLVVLVVVMIPLCLVLYPFGLVGLQIRKGVVTLKALRQVRQQIEARKNTPNARYFSMRRGALWRAVGIPLGWLVGYATLFFVLPRVWFYVSLVGLLAVAIGADGRILVPGVPVDDAFDDFLDA